MLDRCRCDSLRFSRIASLLSKLRVPGNQILLFLVFLTSADTYLRFQIAMETVEKFIVRSGRGEAINLFGDRIWNILFLVSSLLVFFLLGRSLVRSFSRSVEVESAKD